MGVNLRELGIERIEQLFVLADFFFGRGDFEPVVINPLAGFVAAFGVVADALLMPVTFAFEFVVAVDGVIDGAFDFVE